MNFFKKNPVNDSLTDDYYGTGAVDTVDDTENISVPGRSGVSGLDLGGGNIELKVVRPERFDEVAGIADHLLCRRTVVLNLDLANKEVARHLINFLSGVAYAIGGQIKRVANTTYIITPNNVDVSESGSNPESAGYNDIASLD